VGIKSGYHAADRRKGYLFPLVREREEKNIKNRNGLTRRNGKNDTHFESRVYTRFEPRFDTNFTAIAQCARSKESADTHFALEPDDLTARFRARKFRLKTGTIRGQSLVRELVCGA